MDNEGKKLLNKIFFNCLIVTIFAIASIGITIFFYNQNVDLKDKIKQQNSKIVELENEVDRYKMIGEEFENLFISCTEGK